MIFRVLKVFVGLVGAAALVTIAVLLAVYLPGFHKGISPSNRPVEDFSRTDFITIILTAAALMLAALGLILAVAGAIGYVTVRAAAESAAEASARGVAKETAEKVTRAHVDAVATRLVRELVPQLVAGAVRPGSDDDDAFARAEGEKK